MKREQLGQLILASEDSMYHVAKSLLYNDADCQDAIQEAIAKAFDKIGTLKQDTYAKTWLLRILINECYGIMRKEKKIISLETCEQEEPWMERQDYSDLYEALMGLTEEARLAVTLYYMEGYNIREIARMTKVTESAVKSRLARARTKLKNYPKKVKGEDER
ncbi:MAG: sigma-70 family RNA polymerase sigma factor [Lachnospiraceae bacterium]|nr:sigma-70 family RNA polymerase sigma factor [Clostridiaceae bacterium]MDY3825971.1 sigma-70 family RNA polymerase sigma factor [Lachnospiraceae bacterium]